eukprot:324813-Pyramimonas_sp.AAC.1
MCNDLPRGSNGFHCRRNAMDCRWPPMHVLNLRTSSGARRRHVARRAMEYPQEARRFARGATGLLK